MDIAGVFASSGVVDSVHNGDDVLLAITDLGAAVSVMDKMATINARAQATKCNVFSVGEFLRVEHKVTHDGGLGAQYLARGVATSVHGRTESQQPVRAETAAAAVRTRCNELRQRASLGSEVIATAENIMLTQIADVFHVDVSKLVTLLDIHVVAGGASTDRWGKVSNRVVSQQEFTADDYPEDGVTPATLAAGVYDYTQVLHEKLRGLVPLDRINKAVLAGTQSVLALTRRTIIKIERTRDVKYKFARALYKHLRGKVRIPHIDKAQFIGITPLALADSKTITTLLRYVGSTEDPLWCLRVYL
jgi:hypothetical protein